MKIAGWILSGLIGLFLAGASAVPKFVGMAAATDTMAVVGWPVKYLVLIGCIEVVCVVLFLVLAGLIEGNISPSKLPDSAKFATAAITAIFMAWYLSLGRGADTSASMPPTTARRAP